jgi:membrane protease YdiL (CAAX protease family)
VNLRTGTAPDHRKDVVDVPRLSGWLVLVGLMVAVAYAARATSGKPDPQTLYEWTTALSGVIQDGIILGFVLLIAGLNRRRLGLCRPRSFRHAAKLMALAVVSIYVFEILYSSLTHPGNEQGLTPAHWEPRHAAAYVVNAVVICTVIPFVEELTYRGLGYSLLEPLVGRWPSILAIGLLFGLAHGLVVSLPVIAAFGCVLAWIRSVTRSVFPGMVVHALFNAIALIAAVTVGG